MLSCLYSPGDCRNDAACRSELLFCHNNFCQAKIRVSISISFKCLLQDSFEHFSKHIMNDNFLNKRTIKQAVNENAQNLVYELC